MSSSSLPKRPPSLREQDTRIALLLLAPSLIVILGVTLWPIPSTFVLGFLDAPTGVIQTRTFVGRANYITMLKDQPFTETIGRTFYFTIVSVSLELILQSALATLPEELNEAAMIDGANAFQRFFYVRLPLLRPAILVSLIIRTVEAFRVFDIVYIITFGGPAFKTITISYLTYLNSFSYNKQGIGAALSFLISFFTLVMAFIYISILYRSEEN